MSNTPITRTLVNELLLFAGLLFFGFIIMPGLIYLVGGQVFGDFDGGYLQFFGQLTRRLVDGNLVAWFLVLSPWLGIQTIRLTLLALRATSGRGRDAKV
ncbi:MAG: hypothetical protein QNJ19_15290 [Woeseiaceae bacterium]|nr:hypothetical protein [Woeseiaceae bacterium]